MPNRPKQSTEARLDADKWLDRLTIKDALAVMLDNQAEAISALKAALPQIEKAIEAGHQSLSASDRGRLIYAGAGTSARIAVQDGSELLPTFNWPSSRVAYLIAGGPEALLRPVEGAEDSPAAAKEAVAALNITKGDILIGVAASGTTPYSIAALKAGKAAGALTIGIANNAQSPLVAKADYGITLLTGAESVAGSTRMKAGTAQKICLNLISTLVMVRLGRVKQGVMASMRPTNAKLRQRQEQIDAILNR